MAVMKASDLAKTCEEIAKKHKTIYVMGCFGAPMTEVNKTRYINHHSYNRRTNRKPMIQAATADTFGFDCVNLIKGILWGWNGDKNAIYGGATYKVNGVPDVSADGMIAECYSVTTDFGKIEIGEVLWTPGHVGVYVGNGLAVECSPAFLNRVQYTAVGNIGKRVGYNTRTWVKHGKMPWVTYEGAKKQEGGSTVEIEMNVLKKGAKGEQVKTLQRLLDALGYDLGGYGADGSFGPATDKAVRSFQKAEALEVDGSVGKATWTKILKG
jgi:hypothetical protein